MTKKDRKRVSKDGLELAAGPPGEASDAEPRARARRSKAQGSPGATPGGNPEGGFPGIEDLAGHIKPRPKRVMISIRLDAEVLDWYRSIGKGYQSYIGALLAAWKRQQESSAPPRALKSYRSGGKSRKGTAKTPQ